MSIQITLLGHAPKKKDGYSSGGSGSDGGTNGFLHLAWANTEDGEGFTKDNHDSSGHIVFYPFLGMAIDDSLDDDALSFNSYEWTLIGGGAGGCSSTCKCKTCCNYVKCEDYPEDPSTGPVDPSVGPYNPPDDPSTGPVEPEDPSSGPYIDIWCDLDACDGMTYFANVAASFLPYMPSTVRDTEPKRHYMVAIREFFKGDNRYTPNIDLYAMGWIYRWKASSYSALVAQLPSSVRHEEDPTPKIGNPSYNDNTSSYNDRHKGYYLSHTHGMQGSVHQGEDSAFVYMDPIQIAGTNSVYGTDIDFSSSAVGSIMTHTTVPLQFFNDYSTSNLPQCLSTSSGNVETYPYPSTITVDDKTYTLGIDNDQSSQYYGLYYYDLRGHWGSGSSSNPRAYWFIENLPYNAGRTGGWSFVNDLMYAGARYLTVAQNGWAYLSS